MSPNGKPTVALLIETSRAYGRGLCLGVAEYARGHGEWNFLIEERDLRGHLPDWIPTWTGDGIICRISDPSLADLLAAAPCPVIDLYGQIRHPKIPFLDTDAHAVAEMASRFFVNAAFTRFAYCGFPGLWFSDDRAMAFRSEMKRYGAAIVEYAPPESWSTMDVASREALHPSGSPELEKWVASLATGTAILACNDTRAQQLLKVAARIGRRVPEDLAVIGVDDDDVMCELTNPRLTSIRPDTQALGYTAAHWLHQLMQGRTLAHHSLLVPPMHITERASTDVIASDDPIFIRALRFIREHAHEKIDASDVVNHAGLSRSSIDARFLKILGRSVKDEIIRIRIARSLVLLRQTALSLQQIAAACGFATASHYSRLFKESQQMTPGAFRENTIGSRMAE